MKTRQKVRQNGKILYRTVQRAKLQGEQELTGTPIRVIPYDQRTVTTTQMAEDISHATSLTEADVVGVLTALGNEISKALLSGNRVSLVGVGTLNISLSIKRKTSSGQRKPQKTVDDDLKAGEICIHKVLFTPAPELKTKLKGATFMSSGISSSTKVDYDEVDEWLGQWFASHFSLTRKQLEGHFAVSRRNAGNILSTLVEKGKLVRRGSQSTCFYTPAPGCYVSSSSGEE